MLIRLLFFEKLNTFHKSTSEFCFFFLLFSKSRVRASSAVQNPNKLLHVHHFAASNQCSRPDLLENTMVELRSVYVR